MITIKVKLVVSSWEEETECGLEVTGMLTMFYFLSLVMIIGVVPL